LPAAAAARERSKRAVPTIVFHGDRDHTVQHANAVAIVDQAKAAFETERHAAMQSSTHQATSSGGRRYSRSVHTDIDGTPCVESWTLHGAGHAWSGGNPVGSYTDHRGPHASAEMVRFFFSVPRAGSA